MAPYHRAYDQVIFGLTACALGARAGLASALLPKVNCIIYWIFTFLVTLIKMITLTMQVNGLSVLVIQFVDFI